MQSYRLVNPSNPKFKMSIYFPSLFNDLPIIVFCVYLYFTNISYNLWKWGSILNENLIAVDVAGTEAVFISAELILSAHFSIKK